MWFGYVGATLMRKFFILLWHFTITNFLPLDCLQHTIASLLQYMAHTDLELQTFQMLKKALQTIHPQTHFPQHLCLGLSIRWREKHANAKHVDYWRKWQLNKVKPSSTPPLSPLLKCVWVFERSRCSDNEWAPRIEHNSIWILTPLDHNLHLNKML